MDLSFELYYVKQILKELKVDLYKKITDKV